MGDIPEAPEKKQPKRGKLIVFVLLGAVLAAAIVGAVLIFRPKQTVDPTQEAKAACLQDGGVWQDEGQTNPWATVQDPHEPRCWYTAP